MTEDEREELIEKMARALAQSHVNGLVYQDAARAALAVAEPVIWEQIELEFRAKNALIYGIYKTAEDDLREENARLKALVEDAYREGWLDGSKAMPARKLHMAKDWNKSAAAAAIREGEKDD